MLIRFKWAVTPVAERSHILRSLRKDCREQARWR